jgi:hypothetical protein
MRLTALIIVVIVAVLFLIVFNVAGAKKSGKRSDRPMPIDASDSASGDDSEAIVLNGEPAAAAETSPERAAGAPSGSSDSAYRSALRSLAVSERTDPSGKGEPVMKKRSPDNEYRQALRSMDKKR